MKNNDNPEMQNARQEKQKTAEKIETPKVDESVEISDAESKEMMDKILNVLKENEVPAVENNAPLGVPHDLGGKAEFLDRLARQQAEFENYRKRMEKDRIENAMNANAILISQLIDVLDHFEMSLKHNHDKGIKLIYEELNTILERQGLKRIPIDGPFDPKIHEGVITVEGKQDGMILEELQKGYLLNDKLLRASKVKISRSKDKK